MGVCSECTIREKESFPGSELTKSPHGAEDQLMYLTWDTHVSRANLNLFLLHPQRR